MSSVDAADTNRWAIVGRTNQGRSTVSQRTVRGLRLVRAAVVTAWAHRCRGWWRRPPFLPIPDRSHLAWRRTTAYGVDRPVDRADLTAFLLWADRQRKARA